MRRWCEADRHRFQAALAQHPLLVPGVLASTVGVDSGRVRLRLGLPPDSVESRNGVALVVRFEDSFHAAWSSPADLDLVATKLVWLVEEAERTRTRVVELQLDYDCPTSKLHRWAEFLTSLTSGALRGHEVWITSVPAHMDEPRYGEWSSSSSTPAFRPPPRRPIGPPASVKRSARVRPLR